MPSFFFARFGSAGYTWRNLLSFEASLSKVRAEEGKNKGKSIVSEAEQGP